MDDGGIPAAHRSGVPAGKGSFFRCADDGDLLFLVRRLFGLVVRHGAVCAGGVSFEVAKIVPLGTSGHGSRLADLTQLGLVTLTWAAAVAAGLWLLRSELPQDLRRRKGAVYPVVAQGESREILDAGR